MVYIVVILDNTYSNFALGTLWISSTLITCDLTIVLNDIPNIWSYSIQSMNIKHFGYAVCLSRTCIHIVKDTCSEDNCSTSDMIIYTKNNMGYVQLIQKEYDIVLDDCTVSLPDDILTLGASSICFSPLSPHTVTHLDISTNNNVSSLVLHPE